MLRKLLLKLMSWEARKYLFGLSVPIILLIQLAAGTATSLWLHLWSLNVFAIKRAPVSWGPRACASAITHGVVNNWVVPSRNFGSCSLICVLLCSAAWQNVPSTNIWKGWANPKLFLNKMRHFFAFFIRFTFMLSVIIREISTTQI